MGASHRSRPGLVRESNHPLQGRADIFRKDVPSLGTAGGQIERCQCKPGRTAERVSLSPLDTASERGGLAGKQPLALQGRGSELAHLFQAPLLVGDLHASLRQLRDVQLDSQQAELAREV